MKQILAIFNKDARHLWPEILISFATLVAFVLVYPQQWRSAGDPAGLVVGRSFFPTGNGAMGFLAGSLVVLVPISWWILIARLVHVERLVGNTQFWLTRPYEWQKFLAAKILFVAAFVALPFFVAQCALLMEAGFNPASYLPGLFYNLLLVTGVLVLPLVALSALTSGFGRMTLVLLGVILFIAIAALLGSLVPPDTTGSVASYLGDKISFGALVFGCGAAVVIQYARRRLKIAWLLIAAVALSLTALAFTDPDQALMGSKYPVPATGTPAPAEITYAASALHQPVLNDTKDKSELEISIPLETTRVASREAVIPVAVKATIEAANGTRWESPWNVIYNEYFLSGSWASVVRFRIRRSVYERFKANPITLHLTLAIDRARAAGTTNIPVTSSEFAVPGFGICKAESAELNLPSPEVIGINCRSAMHSPGLTYITAQWSNSGCSSDAPRGESILGTAWKGSFDSDPADFGITSIWEFPLNLSNSWAGYNQGTFRRHQLCPGSPLTFTRYELAGRTQIAIAVPDFRIPDLAIGDVDLEQMKK